MNYEDIEADESKTHNGEYLCWAEPVIDKLKKQGYENYGNQLVSPEEAKASGKNFTGNWSRLWRMKKGNDKIDLWHSDEGILVPERKLQALSKKDWQIFPDWWIETKYQKKAAREGRISVIFNLIRNV